MPVVGAEVAMAGSAEAVLSRNSRQALEACLNAACGMSRVQHLKNLRAADQAPEEAEVGDQSLIAMH